MRILFLFLFFWACLPATRAQSDADREAVIGVIQVLFDAMRAGDSSAVRSVFHPEGRLQTAFMDAAGLPRLQTGDLSRFLTAVGTPHEQVFDERIWSYDIRIDGNLASAWTPYSFFLGDQLSHCGVNAFHLIRTGEGWKILQITDTRRREDCRTE